MQLPARIGKYELVEYLGGGMSQVYRAQDTVLGRIVALKILTEQGNADGEVRARFLQEARMAGNITHDNIISVYDFGEERGRQLMVMEILRGESLREAIKGNRTGDLQDKLNTALQIARALEYIHARKIIHRDIKPENIHIEPSGKVKLMDFGIAKTEGLSLTRAGFTLGTPYYMAPEQVMGHQLTNLVDVYAFGVMFSELLSGQKPISGETVERIFDQILHEPLNLEALRHQGVTQQVINLIERCTAKNPADRPQSFTAVALELERIVNGGSTSLFPAASGAPAAQPSAVPKIFAKLPPKLQTQNWIMALSAGGVIVLLGIVFLIGWLVVIAVGGGGTH